MEGNAALNSTSEGPGLLESGYGSGENASGKYSADYMKNLKRYSSVKTVAQSFLDVALLMANASQLKSVMDSGTEFNDL
ncbi:ninjurin-1-like isoform X2 [Petromyzon marinus]|uniref:ninjurin-1-like isoform X2 n=1 Tax=Petromyzon marinus TaxID=7757 RepID=UPI003F6F7849